MGVSSIDESLGKLMITPCLDGFGQYMNGAVPGQSVNMICSISDISSHALRSGTVPCIILSKTIKTWCSYAYTYKFPFPCCTHMYIWCTTLINCSHFRISAVILVVSIMNIHTINYNKINFNIPLSVRSGGSVIHSEGRLIPHEFPITDLHQISDQDGTGRITCTVSSGTAMFYSTTGFLQAGGVVQSTSGKTAALTVNITNIDTFHNKDAYCIEKETKHLYLYLSSSISSEFLSFSADEEFISKFASNIKRDLPKLRHSYTIIIMEHNT